jgi:hypothetical protein
MVMVTVVAHDDSSWEVFHNSDVATVEAPWMVAAWPQLLGSLKNGELGIIFVQAHLVFGLLLASLLAFSFERLYLRRRTGRFADSQESQDSRGRAETQG